MSTPEDFNDLEKMLADLPVREPSRMLDERVAQTLAASPSATRSPLPWLAIAAAALIAGAVTLAVVFGPASSDPENNPGFVQDPPEQPDRDTDPPDDGPAIRLANNPVDAVNLVWTRDIAEELRYTPTGEPFRAVVREAVDTKTWSNPETGEAGQLCIPREELIVVKQETF